MFDDVPFPVRLWESPFAWVGSRTRYQDEPARRLRQNRARVLVWGGAWDFQSAPDEFDEIALVSLRRLFYLVRTTGCCCSLREESWEVESHGRLRDFILRSPSVWPPGLVPPWALSSIQSAIGRAMSMLDERSW